MAALITKRFRNATRAEREREREREGGGSTEREKESASGERENRNGKEAKSSADGARMGEPGRGGDDL